MKNVTIRFTVQFTVAVVGFAGMIALMSSPAVAGGPRGGSSPRGGGGASTAYQITRKAAPYAMATGSYLRNHKEGYTFRENLDASKKYFEHPVKNAWDDIRSRRK